MALRGGYAHVRGEGYVTIGVLIAANSAISAAIARAGL